MKPLIILTLIDDEQMRRAIERLLEARGHLISTALDIDEARRRLMMYRFDVVLVQRGLVEIKPSRFRVIEVGELVEGMWRYDVKEVAREVEMTTVN